VKNSWRGLRTRCQTSTERKEGIASLSSLNQKQQVGGWVTPIRLFYCILQPCSQDAFATGMFFEMKCLQICQASFTDMPSHFNVSKIDLPYHKDSQLSL